MGGFGSGRVGWRPTVEGTGALVLDAGAVVRSAEAARRGGPPGAALQKALPDLPLQVWTWARGGAPWAEAEVALRLGAGRGAARLRSRFAGHAERWREQEVRLEAAPCRFGGQRWWWLCPATGRRCAKLYLPRGGGRPPLFLSRPAHGLAYASQSEDAVARAHRRAAKVHERLGGPGRLACDPEPPRPKGMRRRTYERLLAELRDAADAFEDAFLAGAERLLGRFRG